MGNTLGKNNRLKSRKSIARLFADGNATVATPLRVIYIFGSDHPGLKAGFTCSSRNFPKAVQRNRVKRLMREAYRTRKEDLEETLRTQGWSAELFFIFIGRELPELPQVEHAMTLLMAKLVKTVTSKSK